tara:strand:+ start:1365 stop:2027 length:663 start_codon:yes stop_codon:yes gene_type:complete
MMEVKLVDNVEMELLKRLAKQHGISGVDLAKEMNLTPETISRHMNGKTQMSREDAVKYANIFNINPNRFMQEEEVIPLLGSIDADHYINAFTMTRKKLVGSSIGLPNIVGFQYDEDLQQWMAGRVLLVNGKDIRNKVVNKNSLNALSIAKVKNQDICRLGIVYPLASKHVSLGSEVYYNLINPYGVTTQKENQPVQLEWASNVVIAIQSPKILNYTIVDE